MPAPRLTPNVGGEGVASTQEEKPFLLSIFDTFIHADNPISQSVRSRVPLPILELGSSNAAKALSAANTGVNFALGNGAATPLSAGPAALEANVKGVPIRQADLNYYTAKAAANSPAGVTGPVAPIMLGMYAADKTWDYGVNRPVGTVALLADHDSPLYNGKPITALDANGVPVTTRNTPGFQLTDINAAWNRTETVSAGQAIVASDIVKIPMMGGVLPLFNAMGGIDKYDPWSDTDMQAAQDNPWYVTATGGTDLAMQLVIPPVARAGRIMGMRKLGLTNTIRSAEDITVLRQGFNDFTPDAPSSWKTDPASEYARGIHALAAETNPAKIRANPLIANNFGADKGRLSRIIAQTDDPSTVNEIILGNMGDQQAIVNLAAAAPDYVWELSEADLIMRSNQAQGVPFRPVGPQLEKVNQTFDSALARNRYFADLKTELTAPDGSFRVNSTWKPTTGKASKILYVEPIRTELTKAGYAVRSGDWSDAPQWISQRFEGGNGSLVTSRVQWAGSRSPLGHVSNSGARPDEVSAEWNANVNTVPFLRGNRLVTYEGREMPAYQLVQRIEEHLLSRTDAELPDAWMQAEDIIVKMAAEHYDVPLDLAEKAVIAYRRQIGDAMTYMRESNGYLFDAVHGRIVVDAKTMRQMLSSFQTLPMAEVIRAIKDMGPLWKQAADAGQDATIHIYDSIQKVFRIDVLFRPGYTGKNSVLEPLMSRFLAHGTILADEGLWASMGNFTANSVRKFERIAYYAQLHKVFDASLRTRGLTKEAKALRKELTALAVERHNLQMMIDNGTTELDWLNMPGQSPAARGMYTDEIRGMLVDAQQRLEQVEAALDNRAPEWRQVVEPATQSDVRAKLLEYKAILGDAPEYIAGLEEQGAQIVRQARARVQSPREVAQERIGALERQLQSLEDHAEYLSTEFGSPRPVTVPGSAANAAELKDAFDKADEAWAKQRDGLVQWREAMSKDEIAVAQAEVDRLRAARDEARAAYLGAKDSTVTETYDYTGHGVTRDGKTRATGDIGSEGDVARGRDEQGIANQRQIESLRTQLDAAREELKSASDDVEPVFTPNEQSELRRITGILDRIEQYADPVRREYPEMNRYGGESMGGLGPNRTYVGMVDTDTLANMYGNVTIPGNLTKMRVDTGGFDKSKVTDPIVVMFDPDTKFAYVGEGNHRVALATESGVKQLPVRVVRTRISESDAAKWNAEIAPGTGGPAQRIVRLDVPESPWRNGQGKEYWPPEMHPSFIGLKSPDTASDSIRAQVEELQAMYDNIVLARQSFRPSSHLEEMQALEERAAALEAELGAVEGDVTRRVGRWRRMGADLGPKGYRGTGQGDMTFFIGGDRFDVPAAYSQREFAYGAGYLSESSAQTTNQLTYDPSMRANYETGRWRRSNGTDRIGPNSPLYWDELSHVGNRFFRDDRLIQRYLRGESRQQLALWLKTPEGEAYMKGMGEDYLKPIESFDRRSTQQVLPDDPVQAAAAEIMDIQGRVKKPGTAEPVGRPVLGSTLEGFRGSDGAVGRRPTHVLSSSTTELDEVLRIVDQYFPDKEVQKLLAEREVSAGDLMERMGGREDLSEIVGDDLNYHPSRLDRVRDAYTAAVDKVWHWIATMPEDRIARWPFFQAEFRKQLTNRARVLHEQGVKLDEPQLNALRQASHRQALSELEKTFYNIRRYNTPVYNSRFLMTFPGAFFNSIYRYGRFLMKEPERMLQMGVLGADIVRWGGVDENGDHVDNILDAKYFLVPGTESIDSKGVRIPINSFATLAVNYPSLSIGLLLASSVAQRLHVQTEQNLKSMMGDTMFEAAFPYGVTDNPVSTIAGGWQKDVWRAAWGQNDVDTMKATTDIYAYNMYRWEVDGMNGPQPTLDEAVSQAAAFYAQRGAEKWVSAFSVYTNPQGELMRQAWSQMQKEFGGDTEAARIAFVKKYGDASRWLTFSDTQRTAYVPATMEAYNRIWVDKPDLAKELVKIDPNNPEYVGLLAYGTQGEYSAAVSDALRTTPLPGDREPAAGQMDPVTFEAMTMVSQGWDQYTSAKVKYDAEHLRLSTMRDEATSEFERQYYRDMINGLDISWTGWVDQLEGANKPWARKKNDPSENTAETATLYLNTILGDSSLAKKPEFVKVSQFLQQRQAAKTAYAAAGSDEEKKAIKASFTDYITANFTKNDEVFSGLWDRYYANEWDIANG